LPLAVAAKTRIAFDAGFEDEDVAAHLADCKSEAEAISSTQSGVRAEMVRMGATLPVAPARIADR